MEIILFILAIVVPIYIGWWVWKEMDRRDNPDPKRPRDTLADLIKKTLYSIAVTFLFIFLFFLVLDLMAK
ncbi:MAG: hypothetical protein FGM22_02140 [Burkholderiaceae bacterium]|nr:hypothetical protein [Burkholderiaceae bacterium]